ncbi:HU domain-containing protein [Croceiramulus getboli]|nr:SPOR domain-containing protein [Flavobacteriaceae bacterium YJPT1-3]
MQLESYISDLLYRYECVILPEFGAFLTQYKSAQVHQNTHAFHPPSKVLSFNGQLTANDGLLANYMAKSEAIPHEEANQRIAQEVARMHRELKQGNTLGLKNVGEFHLGDDQQLQFEPSRHLNYLTSSFGLGMFTTPPVAREVYKEQVEELEAKAPLAITESRRGNYNWLKYAAVGLIALSVGGLLGMNYLKNVENYNVVARQEAESQLEQKIQEATFAIDNPLPAITLTATKPSGKYHLVAGAFRIEENADRQVERLRQNGYKARILGTNRYGLHQVVYSSHEDAETALAELKKVRQNENKSAWLLVKTVD